jgi:hypothetical protein
MRADPSGRIVWFRKMAADPRTHSDLNQFTINQMLTLNSLTAAWLGAAAVMAAPVVLREVGQWASAWL